GEPPIEVRIALNTGEAIVGDLGSKTRVDYTVVGNAVNVAARMEEFVATAGDIVIGPATYDAVRDLYKVARLGHDSLKGRSASFRMYKVRAPGSREGRMDPRSAAGRPREGGV